MNPVHRLLRRMFDTWARPVVLILGEPDSGKTDFSLRLAETLMETPLPRTGRIKRVATNIRLLDPPEGFYTVRSYRHLVSWAEMFKKEHKLFILDEAQISLFSREPLSKLSRDFLKEFVTRLRHMSTHVILVAQDPSDLDSRIRVEFDRDNPYVIKRYSTWVRGVFKKINRNYALVYIAPWPLPVHRPLKTHPTTLRFDSKGTYLFTYEDKHGDLSDFDLLKQGNLDETFAKRFPVAWRFKNKQSFEQIKKELNLATRTTALRVCQREVGEMFELLKQFVLRLRIIEPEGRKDGYCVAELIQDPSETRGVPINGNNGKWER